MRRIGKARAWHIGALVALVAAGLAATPAPAAEMALRLPQLTAQRAQGICSPALRAQCGGINERALDRDLACERCAPSTMPADIMPSSRHSTPVGPTTPAGKRQADPCAPSRAPAGPMAPGCLRPPLDAIPQL